MGFRNNGEPKNGAQKAIAFILAGFFVLINIVVFAVIVAWLMGML